MNGRCAGPLVWFDAPPSPAEAAAAAAILECGTCGYVVITGSLNDERHSNIPLLREGITG